MAFIDGTVVNVALPALQSSLHATVVDVQWVIEAYGLFLSALILVGGALGDLFGRRLIFLLGAGFVRPGVGGLRSLRDHFRIGRRPLRSGNRSGCACSGQSCDNQRLF